MSYSITFKVKVEGCARWLPVGDCDANITWNLRRMIEQATGLEWVNEADNGLCTQIMPAIYKGWAELKSNAAKYKQFEAPNGWGTVRDCAEFLFAIIKYWEQLTDDMPDLAACAHFWIE